MTTYNTSSTYTGDGANNLFTITFPYISVSDLDVYVDGEILTPLTDWILTTATTVQITTIPPQGSTILIARNTDASNVKTAIFPGSAIRARDLNDNFAQTLYVVQESADKSNLAEEAAQEALDAAEEARGSAEVAQTALVTANTALADSSAAQSTATAASNEASSALTAANQAESTANAAAQLVSNLSSYDIVNDLSSLPSDPDDLDLVQVINSTGIESSSIITDVPSGFSGDSGLSVDLRYSDSTSKWSYLTYFPNDPDNRYQEAGEVVTIPDATTSVKGIVKLNSAVNQTDQTTAATPLAVKQAYDLATNANTGATTANTLASAALPKSGGTMTGDITFNSTQTIPTSGLPTATTAQSGIVQLNNSVNSTSTTRAATSKAVKDAYDLAQTAVNSGAGGLISTDFKDLSVDSDSVFTIPSNTKRFTVNIVGLKCNSSDLTNVVMAIGSSTSIWTNGQNQDNHSTVFFLDGVDDPVFQADDDFIVLGFNNSTKPLSANLTFSRIVSGNTCYFGGSGTSHSTYENGVPVISTVTSCDVESSETVSRIAIGVLANNGNPDFTENTSGFIGISYYSEL